MPYQLTIQRPFEIDGVGLHTAVRSHLRFVPAPADTGIVFRRVDLDGFEIEAHVRNVARVSYATSLMKQGVLLSTVEHVLAALYSCGVDNVYVELDALELPILDGSSQPYIDLLTRAGKVELITRLAQELQPVHAALLIRPQRRGEPFRHLGRFNAAALAQLPPQRPQRLAAAPHEVRCQAAAAPTGPSCPWRRP